MIELAFFNPSISVAVSLSGCSYTQGVYFSECDFYTAAERKQNKQNGRLKAHTFYSLVTK